MLLAHGRCHFHENRLTYLLIVLVLILLCVQKPGMVCLHICNGFTQAELIHPLMRLYKPLKRPPRPYEILDCSAQTCREEIQRFIACWTWVAQKQIPWSINAAGFFLEILQNLLLQTGPQDGLTLYSCAGTQENEFTICSPVNENANWWISYNPPFFGLWSLSW